MKIVFIQIHSRHVSTREGRPVAKLRQWLDKLGQPSGRIDTTYQNLVSHVVDLENLSDRNRETMDLIDSVDDLSGNDNNNTDHHRDIVQISFQHIILFLQNNLRIMATARTTVREWSTPEKTKITGEPPGPDAKISHTSRGEFRRQDLRVVTPIYKSQTLTSATPVRKAYT
uniref:Uncharacterized protein n=1 Tax=Romanomermis culicivorax TaxID=13658 RepID=A0A915KXN6_ROMCU